MISHLRLIFILGKPASPPSQIDLRIDNPKWSQNGHQVNGINGGVTTPLNPQTTAVSATPPKSPRPPHPMNRSVSAAVVESKRLTHVKDPIAR